MIGGLEVNVVMIGGLEVDVVMIGGLEVNVVMIGELEDVVSYWISSIIVQLGRLCTAGGSVSDSAAHPCGGG